MNAVKITLWMVTVSLSIFVLIIYHLYHFSFARNHHNTNKIYQQLPSSTKRNFDTPMRHIPLDEIYKDIRLHDQDLSLEFEETRRVKYTINTPGCRIPHAVVNYKKKQNKRKSGFCGYRAIYFEREGVDKLRAVINEKALRKYLRRSKSYHCCYRFFQRSTRPGFEHRTLRFSKCKNLQHKETIVLEQDFINVQCFENTARNQTHRIYDDVYAFCKRIKLRNETRCGTKYNVLLLGMDSMSLSRFAQTMSKTAKFVDSKFWPNYRGYHKVGDNTFPNLMASLTGLNISTIVKSCSGRMDQCNDKLIWSIFKSSGYVTAYGEDHLRLPDIFSKDFIYRQSPTDHYIRPFFLKEENEINNHSLLCAGKISAGQQLLDYAMNFVLTYRDDPFFGFFWMNSFSHNMNNHPEDADQMFESFLSRLTYSRAFDKTFIIFLSDHGIRFGENRLLVESYYDDRMPLLYIWPPRKFKMNHPSKLKALIKNQFRLITPYDLYKTLLEINELSQCDASQCDVEKDTSIPKHQSIFSVISPNRTCQDVGIHDKWCSCHNLYPLDAEDAEGIRSVNFAVSHIQSVRKNIKTKRCWSCAHLSLKNVSRIHFYYDKDKVNLYFVVAFSMSPINIFYEATVLHKDTEMNLVGSVSIISPYKGFGDCTIKHKDRIYCVCQKYNDCGT
ncbi:uncharacterized protein LOC120624680 [Pararge aegeria]|uniref:uncharacterized protein LOC120624680 n=1 Tax=Pararge aegeria TaxID=116150 RepID=UPI0019CF5CFA|nr:uncharacterized protein LOC120624680 [Pararge aegeria]